MIRLRRLFWSCAALGVLAGVVWTPDAAAQQSVNVYVGGGVGIFIWKYTETGDFLDINNQIFSDTFVGSGTAVGPVILGGVRVPVGRIAVGGEIRYQHAIGDLPAAESFAGSTIDLGG